jgi:hypothetical protein
LSEIKNLFHAAEVAREVGKSYACFYDWLCKELIPLPSYRVYLGENVFLLWTPEDVAHLKEVIKDIKPVRGRPRKADADCA